MRYNDRKNTKVKRDLLENLYFKLQPRSFTKKFAW